MNNSITKIKSPVSGYKKILIPILLILGSFILIFLVIMPQISSITEKIAQIAEQKRLIVTLRNSQKNISNAQTTVVDENFATAITALPTQKDISLIFDALSRAAAASDTSVDSFTLNVGGVFGRAAQESAAAGNPAVVVSSHISGSTEGLVNFTKQLEKALPISEIKKISITGTDASFEINFFYKPVSAGNVAAQDNIKPLSQADKNTLEKLKEWESQ